MLGYPLTPPLLGTMAADRPTHLPPPPLPFPPSRPPKVFAPGWGIEFEQAAPLGGASCSVGAEGNLPRDPRGRTGWD